MEDLTTGERTILALLYAPGKENRVGQPLFGRVVLAKLLFLLWKNPRTHALLEEADFEPYDYGPWADWIDVALDELGSRGLLSQQQGRATRIGLTRKGTGPAREAFEELSSEQKGVISDIRENFGRMSTESLLEYVYAAFPEYAKESKWVKQKRT